MDKSQICSVQEVKLKGYLLCELYDLLEKTKLLGHKIDQWLPRAKIAGRVWLQRGVLESDRIILYLVYNGGYMTGMSLP